MDVVLYKCKTVKKCKWSSNCDIPHQGSGWMEQHSCSVKIKDHPPERSHTIHPPRADLQEVELPTLYNASMQVQAYVLALPLTKAPWRRVPIHAKHGRTHGQAKESLSTRWPPQRPSAVADALECVFLHQRVTWSTHYIDDFLTMGQAKTTECRDNIDIILRVCWGSH